MADAMTQDVTMSERALRVEAHRVDGEDPSLCYAALFMTDEHGQWLLIRDWSFGRFGDDVERTAAVKSIGRAIERMLRP